MTETKEQFCERLQKAILARFRQKEWQRKKRIEQRKQQESDYLCFTISSINRIKQYSGVR
jgi:hypothetical protein